MNVKRARPTGAMPGIEAELFPGLHEDLRILRLEILRAFSGSRLPDLLWHYTTGTGLIGIVESGSIWATQISCLNDSSEYAYSSEVLFKAFARIRELKPSEACLQYLFNEITKNELRSKESPSRFRAKWFVTCLSGGNGDDLSQWRAYSGGENGFAIGFDSEGLAEHFPQQAIYLQDTGFVDRVCKDICNIFCKGFGKVQPAMPSKWTEMFLKELGNFLDLFGAVIKNPAFVGEDEFRLVHEFSTREVKKLKFRQQQSLLSRYLPLSFPEYVSRTSRKLPIMEIRVGPSRHQQASAASVEMLLQKYKYDQAVVISCSPIPYQRT